VNAYDAIAERAGIPTPVREPPWSDVAEASVLASLLSSPHLIAEAQAVLTAEDFYLRKNANVFRLMCESYANVGNVDETTLLALLSEDPDTKDEPRETWLRMLATIGGGSGWALGQHLELVKEKSRLRALLRSAETIQRHVLAGLDSRTVIDTQRSGFDAIDKDAANPVESVADMLADAFAKIDSPVAQRGIPTGLHQIDWLIGGMKPGQLIVVGGRPSMGKSALVQNIAHRVATKGANVCFLSCEMTEPEIVVRAIGFYSGLNTNRLEGGGMFAEGERAMLDEAKRELRAHPLYLRAIPAASPEDVRAAARAMQQKHGLDLIVIDHLHKMSPPARLRRNANETELYTAISGDVKALALSLGVPVILACQLNREAAKINRQNGKHRNTEEEHAQAESEVHPPTLTDLRSSGAIEQDADVVMLVHRPGYYTGDRRSRTAYAIVAKNRGGETGTANLLWDGPCQRFTDVDVPA
jgi:replicative DNA helicase